MKVNKSYVFFILSLFLLLLLSTACSRMSRTMQPLAGSGYLLQQGKPVGQTFVAGYGGLEKFEAFLIPEENGSGIIRLHLRMDAFSNEDLAAAQIPLSDVNEAGYYTFQFNPQPDSQREYYYALLEVEGEGAVAVGSSDGETYLEGSLYYEHIPRDAQMAFKLTYNFPLAGWGLIKLFSSWILILLAGVLLFVMPGWALVQFIRPSGLDWAEKTALSAGITLALIPLIVLWTGAAGIRLGAAYAWLLVLVGLAAATTAVIRKRNAAKINQNKSETSYRTDDKQNPKIRGVSHQTALVGLLIMIIFTRFWPVRNLEGPMWGDSVQHTVIAQLLLDNRGLFESWLPYAQYESLTVQYGFSAVTAFFSWLTGLSSLQASLWTGQLMNILAVLALYPLAVRIAGGRRWAGVGAVLAAGLLSPIPAIYMNWGRYAQLSGQVILPVSLWLLWEVLEKSTLKENLLEASKIERIHQRIRSISLDIKNLPWITILTAGMVLSGMVLSYYRMAFFYATFLLILILGWALPRWRFNFRPWGLAFSAALFCGLIALVGLFPWVLNVMGGHLAAAVGSGVTAASQFENVLEDYRSWLYTFLHMPAWLSALGIAAVSVSLLKREWLAAAISLWVLLLASIVGLSLFRIPGANMMQNFAVIIALYIPAGLLIGWLVGWFSTSPLLKNSLGQVSISIIILLIGAWGAQGQRTLIQPGQYAMLMKPDIRAMEWIDENLPAESLFLVEGFTVYGGYTAVGSDAGWWLPLLTQRANTMPPQYALMNEKPVQDGYTNSVVTLVSDLEKHRPDSLEGRKQLCNWGITHIYIGQGQGKISTDRYQLFSPDDFLLSPNFEAIYNQDRVFIFAHHLENCEEF
jgi:hypothetical protein